MVTSPSGHPDVTGRLATRRAGLVLDQVVAACHEIDYPVRDARPRAVALDTGIGVIHFTARPAELGIRIAADSAANAFMLRESVLARIEALDPALVPAVAWSAPLPGPGLPPNFRVARVLGVTAPCPSFRRVEISAPDLAPFARDGLHLRLALPPAGRRPVWPGIDAAGRTRWPSGPDALHIAVYTIRRVDPAAGTMTVDAFHHGRGATCAWIDAARPGDPLGLVGPGGGWYPRAPHLTLAGDETALPAIARILDAAAPGTTGTALVEVDDAGAAPPIQAPPGIALRLLSRARGECLEDDLARLDLGPAGGRHVWFAAEKARAQAMRRHLRDARGLQSAESTVAGYWVDR